MISGGLQNLQEAHNLNLKILLFWPEGRIYLPIQSIMLHDRPAYNNQLKTGRKGIARREEGMNKGLGIIVQQSLGRAILTKRKDTYHLRHSWSGSGARRGLFQTARGDWRRRHWYWGRWVSSHSVCSWHGRWYHVRVTTRPVPGMCIVASRVIRVLCCWWMSLCGILAMW